MKILLLDIEVSPNVGYFWSAGYKLNIGYESIEEERKIICICYKWLNEPDCHSVVWSKGKSDKKVVQDIVKVIAEADFIVGHNIKKFDIKWIRTRCFFHKIAMPTGFKCIDTLTKARSNFYFNSNRLDYVAKFMGSQGKDDKISYSDWIKITKSNDPESLAKMVEYCKQDVFELEKVYNELNLHIQTDYHKGVENGHKRYTCPKCSSRNIIMKANSISAAGIKTKRCKCNSCQYHYRIAWSVYMDFLRDREDGII